MKAIAAIPDDPVPRILDVSAPGAPGPGDVLCRTRQLGICGTDREILLSRHPLVPQGEHFLVLGHECLGEVVALGRDVTGLRPGELVVPVVRRPSPDARRRPDLLAVGQFTERGIFYEHGFSMPRWIDQPQYLVPVPAELADIAVFTEPLAVVEKAVHEALILQTARLGSTAWPLDKPRVLITGLGPIAFAAMLACRVRGWPATVAGRDRPDTFRAQLAQRIGATYVDAGLWQKAPADVEVEGYDLVLECTGSDDVVVPTSLWLASCGIMVWLGSVRVPRPREHNLALVMRDAVIRNHLFLGTVNAALRDFQAAVSDLRWWHAHDSGAVEMIITSRVTLEESLWHCQHREPQGVKCVVMYD